MTCVWPLPAGDLEGIPVDWNTLPDSVKDRARALATQSMERLTLGRVSNCPVTVLVSRQPVHSVNWAAYTMQTPVIYPINWNGEWFNASSCLCVPMNCDLTLPRPVGRVDEVKVDGVVVDPVDYEIRAGNRLTWIGAGSCPFPLPGDVEVTYLNAHAPDDMGLFAALVLASEFALAMTDPDSCRLPEGTTNVVRQGLSLNVVPGTFPNGRTGIHEIDAWLGVWNPQGLSQPSQVWSPDLANTSPGG